MYIEYQAQSATRLVYIHGVVPQFLVFWFRIVEADAGLGDSCLAIKPIKILRRGNEPIGIFVPNT
jgi:hypothetical protein